MAETVKTIYRISRDRAKLSREAAAEQLNISASQLERYEFPKFHPEYCEAPADVVREMMRVYNDERLGYLHLMDTNAVARAFLPANVERQTLLQAVVQLSLDIEEYIKDNSTILKIAKDEKVSEDELPKWMKSKKSIKALVADYLALLWADGIDEGE